ncbi:TIGR03792 family protein [Phormidium tenue FACHB-886]|nr:TIGR03792 family protein [Phormidium tenue FACHB-886]
MVIEWLKVQVDPEQRELYVQKDAEIWTTALSKYPGFLSKEVWISPENFSELIIVIHWASLENWKSIPAADLQQIEAEFNQAMGEVEQSIVASSSYQVRKTFRSL